MMMLAPALMSAVWAGQYVVGDVVNVRAEPRADAAVRWRLRINTEVDVLDTGTGWSQVRMVGRPEASPVTGWIASSLLGTTPLDDHVVAERARKAWAAGEVDTALREAQRAFALDPGHRGHAEQLRDLYRAVDRNVDAARVMAVHEGTHGVFLGVCDGSRVSLVAHWQPGGPLTDVSGTAFRHQEVARDLQAQMMRDAAATPWFIATPEQSEPVSGTPFPRPFQTTLWNEGTRQMHASPEAEPCGSECVVRLGTCTEAGAVYATAPLEPTPIVAVGQQKAVGAFVREVGRQHDLRWPQLTIAGPQAHEVGPWTLVTGEVTGFPTDPQRAHHGAVVLGPDLEPVFTLGAYLPAQHTPEGGSMSLGPPDATQPRWFRLRVGGNPRWLGVFDINAEKSMSKGAGIVILDESGEGPTIRPVYEASGC